MSWSDISKLNKIDQPPLSWTFLDKSGLSTTTTSNDLQFQQAHNEHLTVADAVEVHHINTLLRLKANPTTIKTTIGDDETSIEPTTTNRTLTLDLIPDDVRNHINQITVYGHPVIDFQQNNKITSRSSNNNSNSNSNNNTNHRTGSTSTGQLLLSTKVRTTTKPLSIQQSNNNNNSIIMSSTANLNIHNTTISNSTGYHIGLYGWRKKCLFIVIFGLMLLIIINLSLTLWILKVMEFSSEGMGSLKVLPGGLQLTGQALILDLLKVSTIRSRHGQPISIESYRNFSINTRDWEGNVENNLFLGHDKFEIQAHNLKIVDVHGGTLFSADKNEIQIGANSLRVDGEGGAIFRESVQTPIIRAEPGRELKFESPTRSLQINAGQDIFVKSGAGSMDINCLNDIRLHSEAGSIRLDSSNVLIPNLKTVQQLSSGGGGGSDHNSNNNNNNNNMPHQKVYQLCACANGKLFLAQSHGICAGDDSIVCR